MGKQMMGVLHILRDTAIQDCELGPAGTCSRVTRPITALHASRDAVS